MMNDSSRDGRWYYVVQRSPEEEKLEVYRYRCCVGWFFTEVNAESLSEYEHDQRLSDKPTVKCDSRMWQAASQRCDATWREDHQARLRLENLAISFRSRSRHFCLQVFLLQC